MKPEELASAIIEHGAAYLRHNARINRDAFEGVDIDAAIDLARQALAAQPAPTAEPVGFGDREPTDTERELFQCLDAFIKRADIKHDGPNLDRDARGVAALLSDSHPRGYASAEPADKFNRWYGFDVRRTGPTELTVTLSADTFDVFPHDEFMSGTDPVHEIFVVVVDVERKAACCVRAARVGNSAAQNEIDQGPSRDPTAALANLLDDVNRDMGRGTGWREFENPPAPVAGNLRAQLLLEGAADLQREALNLLWPRECGTLADCDDEPTPF